MNVAESFVLETWRNAIFVVSIHNFYNLHPVEYQVFENPKTRKTILEQYIMKWESWNITLWEANKEARPTGMKTTPTRIKVVITWKWWSVSEKPQMILLQQYIVISQYKGTNNANCRLYPTGSQNWFASRKFLLGEPRICKNEDKDKHIKADNTNPNKYKPFVIGVSS